MTRKTKQTVFISSTYIDLVPFRKEAWNALNKLKLKVKGMERFGARTESSLETCLNEVSTSDIYIGIIAYRFGSIDDKTGKSFTQLEYEKAIAENKKILIYFPNPENVGIIPKFYDSPENLLKLEDFKNVLRENHTIDHYLSPEDLGERIEECLSDLLDLKPVTVEKADRDLSIIEDFCVMPKKFSGVEIEAEVELTGLPFAASRALCKYFGFEYGRVAGINFKFVNNKGTSNLPNELFFKEEYYDLIKTVIKSETKRATIALSLEFSEEPVKRIKANFREYTSASAAYIIDAGFYQTVEADGHILLNINKINIKD